MRISVQSRVANSPFSPEMSRQNPCVCSRGVGLRCMRPHSDHAQDTVLRARVCVLRKQVMQSDMCTGINNAVYAAIMIETVQRRDRIPV